ncbi:MAG: TetR family transcriptional regulator [Desulfobacter sp.]|nr:TetR family transcriptional regulator [Desulfobacter sp.]
MGLSERRLREKLLRRKQILNAARALLFEKGIKATSISQIAKVAELEVGTSSVRLGCCI